MRHRSHPICVVDCYIVSADIALWVKLQYLIIHDNIRKCCDFNPVCNMGYFASIIGWFESTLVDFFSAVFPMFYFIIFYLMFLLLWQWNDTSYMYFWHKLQIKNNNQIILTLWVHMYFTSPPLFCWMLPRDITKHGSLYHGEHSAEQLD